MEPIVSQPEERESERMQKTAPVAGIAKVDRYLDDGFQSVLGMSSRFATAICCGLLRIQRELGLTGPVAEIGPFEGRFFIGMALALAPGEKALGIDLFNWPDPGVVDRLAANCARMGVGVGQRVLWTADSREMKPEEMLAKLGGQKARLIHIDGEHSKSALTKDMELASATLQPGGLIVLDDMLHPGYPMLVVAVQQYLERHPDMRVLCIIDRETVVAATKFVLCRREWFERYEKALLEAYRDHVWPLGADFEPEWCLVLSQDTKLADITS